jgi:hypothetical protein
MDNFHRRRGRSPWKNPPGPGCQNGGVAGNVINYEAAQPPLYYTLAGLWWRGEGVRISRRLFALLGPVPEHLFVVALVWLGFVAARMIFPENLFLKIGVPALLAFFPQTAFYSIQNDVLSPLCFGAAFICLVKLLRADAPGCGWGRRRAWRWRPRI